MRLPHCAPGDPLSVTRPAQSAAPRARAGAGSARGTAPRQGRFSGNRRWPRWRGPQPVVERRLPGSGIRRFVGESAGRAEEGRVARPAAADPGHRRGRDRACVIVGTYLWLADLALPAASSRHVFLGVSGSRCFAGTRSTPTPGTRTRSRRTSSTGSTRWASSRGSAASSSRPSRSIETQDGQKVQTEKRDPARLRAREHGSRTTTPGRSSRTRRA